MAKPDYTQMTETQLNAAARKQRKIYEDAQAELIDIKREINKIWNDVPSRHKRKRGQKAKAPAKKKGATKAKAGTKKK